MSDTAVLDQPQTVTAKRVLVAEDNRTTRELLELLLTERGYLVDSVVDGEAALKQLQRTDYDVVLLDFHLPKMDGLEVAASARGGRGDRKGPRFVAITSDMTGLLGHAGNVENFDRVLPKPFDLNEVCNVIEGEAIGADREVGSRPVERPVVRRRAIAAETTSHRNAGVFADMGFAFLRWPDDFPADLVEEAAGRDHDALLVCEPAKPADLAALWTEPGLHVLPVIDLAGTLGPRADLVLPHGEPDAEAAIDRVVRAFGYRRDRIHRDLLNTGEFGDRLLARIYAAGERLAAAYDPGSPSAVCLGTVHDYAVVDRAASELAESGFLERTFFDRFHICDRCGSSRFNVREECAHCRSPDLAEEAYLHHFKCAYQGPESDFRSGDRLICPKCRRHLAHYSVDYDKPGTMLKCRACGKASSEPTVGMLCLDCGAHFDGDRATQRDVHSYTLTDHGLAFVQSGRALFGGRRGTMRFAELPLEVIVALNGELKKFERDGTPFTLLDISYRHAREIEQEHGARQFDRVRDLFLENLGNVLRREDRVFRGHSCDFALLRGITAEQSRTGLQDLLGQATASLGLDLGPQLHAYAAEDLAQ